MLSAPAVAADCEDLAGLDLGTGQVTSASIAAAGGFQQPAAPGGPPPGVANAAYRDLPEFCPIQATLTPSSDSDIKVEIWATRPTAMPALPGAPAAPPRPPLSRPVCPYPLLAEYDGEGHMASAESFRCAAPPAG